MENQATEKYDSTADTLKHIRMVQKFLNDFSIELIKRGEAHDASKLESPEKEAFDEATPKLKSLVYGSEEYKASLKDLGEALQHHYRHNSHHPEHYVHGVADMTLFDLVEMFCDWRAAAMRNKPGKLNLEKSFDRFHFDPQLANIFRRTAAHLEIELDNEL